MIQLWTLSVVKMTLSRSPQDIQDDLENKIITLELEVAHLRQQLSAVDMVNHHWTNLRQIYRQGVAEHQALKTRCNIAEQLLESIGFKRIDNGQWRCQTPIRRRDGAGQIEETSST